MKIIDKIRQYCEFVRKNDSRVSHVEIVYFTEKRQRQYLVRFYHHTKKRGWRVMYILRIKKEAFIKKKS